MAMRLVITIPTYNEETTLAKVISKLPRSIPGVSSIKVLFVDDGSTDNTLKITKANVNFMMGCGNYLDSVNNDLQACHFDLFIKNLSKITPLT